MDVKFIIVLISSALLLGCNEESRTSPVAETHVIDLDGDGYTNQNDAFPNDASEWLDTDSDSIGDNADDDDDNDGYKDADELAAETDPLDKQSVPADLDGDFISDVTDTDIDGDGYINQNDALPEDPTKWVVENNYLIGKKLLAYTSRVSYSAGETLELKVHSEQNADFNLDIIRLGITNQSVYSQASILAQEQKYKPETYLYGCNWDTAASVVIGNDWVSGYYVAVLTTSDGSKEEVPFIVKGTGSDVAMLASTNTWHAYNGFGGVSYYGKNGSRTTSVHFNRPLIFNSNSTSGHLGSAEINIAKWLEANNHGYDLISDLDLHENSSLLTNYKTLIISVHGEYWTEEMYNNLESFLGSGGNLLYLSGNGIYWQVTIENGLMVRHKRWREVSRPESAVLGVEYTSGGYNTYAGYKVIEPSHWVFDNTGVKIDDVIGITGINGRGASGRETDKVTPFTPQNITLLAKGKNPDNTGADMLIYNHVGGGYVFSVGSITFGQSLAIDATLTKMINNVLIEMNN